VKADALRGLRVLDFTAFMSGPLCTRMLADCGAEVIKVEPPQGDAMRGNPPMRGGFSALFAQLNCGKSSIVLDLAQAQDRAAAKALAREVDIVVENFRPGVMRRHGLDDASLRPSNPRLVYCSISGFGQAGPLAMFPAYAPTVHAASGFDAMQAAYQDVNARPANCGIFLADVMGGCNAFGAIQLALYHRERTGLGQAIDVSLADAMIGTLLREIQDAQLAPAPRRHLFQGLKTADGFMMVAPASTRNCEALCELVGHPEWMQDPRFASMAQRVLHWDALMRLVEVWTAARSSAECEAAFLAAGVAASRYRSVNEVIEDPHYLQRGTFSEVGEEPHRLRVTGAPFQLSAVSTQVRGWFPALGADSTRVLGAVRPADSPTPNSTETR
jgi:crotonobetainyl-CoA:carnitine CoA-transferase CaiB-like acyl-CoA transferase